MLPEIGILWDLGGKEKDWIGAYVRERQKWLAASDRAGVRNSVYRTKALKGQIDADNWALERLPIMANGIAVYPKTS